MKKTSEELAQHALGELATLSVAVHALLTTHPQRDEVAAKIHAGVEELLARTEPQPFPQDFLDGIRRARSALMRDPPDPGQPRTR